MTFAWASDTAKSREMGGNMIMRDILRALRNTFRNWRASSVMGRVERRLGDVEKHISNVNFSLGVLNEHVLEEIQMRQSTKNLNDEILASMGNINKNIAELFECLIELDRTQKALTARLERMH